MTTLEIANNFAAQQRIFRENLSDGSRKRLSCELGISAPTLDALGVGFDSFAYTIPEYDTSGHVVGFLLRKPETGGKCLLEGGRRGLYLPCGVTSANAEAIAEGASDTAAALDLGFSTIGLPSCGSCLSEAVAFVAAGVSPRCYTVFGHDDSAGHDGAEALADALVAAGLSCRCVFPPEPHNDLRDWLRAGATSYRVQRHIEAATYRLGANWVRGWTMVPNSLVRSGVAAEIGGTAWLVLCAIASFDDGKNPPSPSRPQIAKLAGCKLRAVDEAKKVLRAHGLLAWDKGYGDASGTRNVCNRYHLNVGPIYPSQHAPPARPFFGYRIPDKEERDEGCPACESIRGGVNPCAVNA